MSFTSVLKPSINQLSQTLRKLDSRVKVFCAQLADRLEVDPSKLEVEFEACLKIFELEQSPKKIVEKLSPQQKEEEKERKLKEKEEEKQRKLKEKEEEKERKLKEKEEEKQKKLKEKEEEKERKLKEKEELKKQKKEKKEDKDEIDLSYFEKFVAIEYDKEDEYWKKGMKRTINKEKVFIHEDTNLILSLTDDEPTLYGLLVGKSVVLSSKMTDDKFQVLLNWVEECGINL